MPRKKKMPEDNYILAYYQQIKNGSVTVGRWISLLYEYLVHGIEEKQFFFDQKKANTAIDWFETHCFHTEGPLAPGLIKLELWQKAFLSAIFGIVDQNGLRQFREVVLVVARKNGKSLLASGIGNYVFRSEGGYGAKVFCIAPKLEQADIVYNNLWQMITLDPEWQAMKLAVQESKDEHNRKTIDDSMIAPHRQSDLSVPGTNSMVKKIAFAALPSTPHHSPNEGMILPRNKKFPENVKWKIANIITRKMGIPAHLCVSTLSTLSDLDSSS